MLVQAQCCCCYCCYCCSAAAVVSGGRLLRESHMFVLCVCVCVRARACTQASGDEEAAFNRSAGPVPGSVSSQQRNADLAARRMKLQSKYPNLPHND